MLLTTIKWTSLGSFWNLAQRHTLNTMSSLDAVWCKREPIIPLYVFHAPLLHLPRVSPRRLHSHTASREPPLEAASSHVGLVSRWGDEILRWVHCFVTGRQSRREQFVFFNYWLHTPLYKALNHSSNQIKTNSNNYNHKLNSKWKCPKWGSISTSWGRKYN